MSFCYRCFSLLQWPWCQRGWVKTGWSGTLRLTVAKGSFFCYPLFLQLGQLWYLAIFRIIMRCWIQWYQNWARGFFSRGSGGCWTCMHKLYSALPPLKPVIVCSVHFSRSWKGRLCPFANLEREWRYWCPWNAPRYALFRGGLFPNQTIFSCSQEGVTSETSHWSRLYFMIFYIVTMVSGITNCNTFQNNLVGSVCVNFLKNWQQVINVSEKKLETCQHSCGFPWVLSCLLRFDL